MVEREVYMNDGENYLCVTNRCVYSRFMMSEEEEEEDDCFFRA